MDSDYPSLILGVTIATAAHGSLSSPLRVSRSNRLQVEGGSESFARQSTKHNPSGAAGTGQSREERRLDVAICFGTLSQGHEFLLR